MALPWHLYLMASLYILAGINHFRVPRMYVRMIPPAFPAPKTLNYISGAAEILLGVLLCIPEFTALAAWGIIALLIAVFPANVYMLMNEKAGMGISGWILLLRLPLQLALLYWAWLYTKF
ncbi:DoxX family protein [Flavobacterium sp. MFBS3-15]|uniref:DoxX family protein n=1 Tax=Flavobacterium sp. MFBS3-15 TaxID=2989816 RepID=UPI002236475D|nr:DoxX family protein [Flavobacterium sp. MFBS3-15]MCW4470550.1 DoxX family protein [Flavobacterium sp. MFBS3-15]